jgi:glycosyltransferase involved in cell wall biosynthesis
MRNEAIDTGGTAPKVTVLMAVYNGERYLRDAIDSILRQTFTDFEFIIVDDGSKDGSRDIILFYCGDPRVRLIDNPSNVGLTRSLNRGLALARGTLVARQDADDISYPQRLARQVSFMDSHPGTALLGTQVRHIGKDGRPNRAAEWEKAVTDLGIRWQTLFDSPFVHASVMFRTDMVREGLGGYDERFATSQDYELWSRIVACQSVANLPEALLDFRSHPGSVSKRYTDANVRMVEGVILDNVRRYLGEDDAFDEWPHLWVRIVNAAILGPDDSSGRAVDLIASMYARFVERNPAAGNSPEIRRHLAHKLMYVAHHFAPQDRRAALRAFRASHRADPAAARGGAAKLAAFLLFGEAARSGRRMLSGIGEKIRSSRGY